MFPISYVEGEARVLGVGWTTTNFKEDMDIYTKARRLYAGIRANWIL